MDDRRWRRGVTWRRIRGWWRARVATLDWDDILQRARRTAGQAFVPIAPTALLTSWELWGEALLACGGAAVAFLVTALFHVVKGLLEPPRPIP